MTKPALTTKRLEIHRHAIERPECTGGGTYTVWHAWLKLEPHGDVSRPVCFVTIGLLGFVEWIYVDEDYRRLGIATEALEAIETQYEEICLDGATDCGDAFVNAFIAREPQA